MTRLTNVHEALANAATESELASEKMEKKTFYARASSFEACAVICERHGTTVSEFLRSCMDGLVHDYEVEAAADAHEEHAGD